MINDIQNNFREIFQSGIKEPQLVCDRNAPIAVILDMASFKKLTDFPTISDLLDELDIIKEKEPADIDIPLRKDRLNVFGVTDDISL